MSLKPNSGHLVPTTQETPQVPFCIVLNLPSMKRSSPEAHRSPNVAHGQASKGKIWDRKFNVLHVYFMKSCVFPAGFSTSTVMLLAEKWEHPNHPLIPKFQETNDPKMAEIRVEVKGMRILYLVHAAFIYIYI